MFKATTAVLFVALAFGTSTAPSASAIPYTVYCYEVYGPDAMTVRVCPPGLSA